MLKKKKLVFGGLGAQKKIWKSQIFRYLQTQVLVQSMRRLKIKFSNKKAKKYFLQEILLLPKEQSQTISKNDSKDSKRVNRHRTILGVPQINRRRISEFQVELRFRTAKNSKTNSQGPQQRIFRVLDRAPKEHSPKFYRTHFCAILQRRTRP